MTHPALKAIAPELVKLLERADSARRRRAAVLASSLAIERSGLKDPRVDQAISALASGRVGEGAERTAVQALTHELDNVAWEIQDNVDSGMAQQEQYLAAFAKARAAAALDFAFESDSLKAAFETLYEAHHSIQDLDSLRAVVREALT